ncbi:MAG: CoB--CoM heterodisulfide reductase subunit B [Candidatus Methanoperedens sp.]|nr:CoB--CoM heterodisulfide reductase subunit B [Candidatus Methanoperedens sp.]MCE8426080.1 CoB--CoM heterodisulfide reductase subunit B [Candidatus Methanoperedens sp.]MCE8428820.1 CoB--CoM heterodisulfide reductase subunit B [Candidatus Methanoperedens sp.]
MKDISLFLGCLIPNRYPGIEKATKLILERLGIKWSELKEASCCPAPGIFRSFDKITWLTIASRNLVIAEEKNTDILTICNGCFSSLMDANCILKNDSHIRNDVNAHLKKINKEFIGTIEVRHIIEFLYKEIGPHDLSKFIEKPLEINVAVHYGCHLLKPTKERKLGGFECPVFFDELVEATGAKSVQYESKTSCCGAGGGVRSAMLETSYKMTEYKLERIKKAGVDCIVDACPFCHLQYDSGQVELARSGAVYDIPVVHYTQLLGLALGYSPEDVGLHLNKIKSKPFLEKIARTQKTSHVAYLK